MSVQFRTALLVILTAGGAGGCGTRPTDSDDAAALSAPSHESHTLSNADVQELRRATDRFHRLGEALSEGYAIFGGCFSDPTMGGMGQHYANDGLIADPAIRLRNPELLLYETDADGRQHLVAVEYIVFVDDWQAAGNTAPPRLFDTDFHNNSTLLPEPFYLLHAWVWKRNPIGLVSDWNPRVSCN